MNDYQDFCQNGYPLFAAGHGYPQGIRRGPFSESDCSSCEYVSELQCLLQVIVLNCLREGDLGKDSGRLFRHSKECCEVPGRICSERNNAVYLRCFNIKTVGIQ